jgi:hypothetical protein
MGKQFSDYRQSPHKPRKRRTSSAFVQALRFDAANPPQFVNFGTEIPAILCEN